MLCWKYAAATTNNHGKDAPEVDLEQMTREQDDAVPLQILAADDDALGARLLGMFLHRLGFAATVVGSGVEVLAQLSAHPFDLVMLDVEMPGKDGFTTLQEMQTRGCTVPVIAVTGHAGAEYQARCLAAGFAGYLSKPLHLAGVDAEIRRVLHQQAQAPALAAAPRATGSALDAVARELEISPATLALLLRAFLGSAPPDVAAMLAAAGAGDAPRAQHYAHRLRGSLGSLAAHDLAALAARIEAQARDGELAAAETTLHAFNSGFLAFCTRIEGWLNAQDDRPGTQS